MDISFYISNVHEIILSKTFDPVLSKKLVLKNMSSLFEEQAK